MLHFWLSHEWKGNDSFWSEVYLSEHGKKKKLFLIYEVFNLKLLAFTKNKFKKKMEVLLYP